LETKDYTVEKIQLNYMFNLIKIFTFLMSGEIALVGIVVKTGGNKIIALFAIFFMLLAILLSYSVAETIVRRISPKPNFKSKIMNKIINFLPISLESEYIKSLLAGVCGALSMILYIVFVLVSILVGFMIYKNYDLQNVLLTLLAFAGALWGMNEYGKSVKTKEK